MKQYKLIIKENFSENITGILNKEAKGGWKLNSLESSRNLQVRTAHESGKLQVVLVLEKY